MLEVFDLLLQPGPQLWSQFTIPKTRAWFTNSSPWNDILWPCKRCAQKYMNENTCLPIRVLAPMAKGRPKKRVGAPFGGVYQKQRLHKS